MKALWLLGFLVAVTPVAAEPADEWQFVLVERSTNLIVSTGTGVVTISAGKLSGRLLGQHDVPYSLVGTIKRGKVSAVLTPLESDAGGTRVAGTFSQTVLPARGGTECWQTLQLSDGFSSVSLARNVARCEP